MIPVYEVSFSDIIVYNIIFSFMNVTTLVMVNLSFNGVIYFFPKNEITRSEK